VRPFGRVDLPDVVLLRRLVVFEVGASSPDADSDVASLVDATPSASATSSAFLVLGERLGVVLFRRVVRFVFFGASSSSTVGVTS
jgi:hypothetical protein